MESNPSRASSYSFSGRIKNSHISEHIAYLLEHFNRYSGQHISINDIDSVFGFTDRYCSLYGGRSFNAYEPARIQITDDEISWMYDVGIGLKIALSAPKVSRKEYLACRTYLDRYYRKGNTLIITNDKFAEWIREDYPDYLIEASVIRNTDSQEAIKSAAQIYDYIVVPIILNDDSNFLGNIEEKKKIRLFVNAECSYNCPSRICYSVQSNINKRKKTIEEFLYSILDLDYPNVEVGDSKLITLKNNNNKPLVQFILGKKKKDGVYLKKINDKQTWLTTGILEMSKFEKDWLETKIMDISYENIKKILINRSDNDGAFSLTKDEKNENLLIDNLNKDQIPKSDLIANFLGYFFTNLVFDDVVKREENIDNNLSIKINFELKNGSRITGVIFTKNKNKWININIDGASIEEIKKNNKIYVNDVNQWSYMIPSTKYSVIDTKLKDLLVEE